MTDIQPQELVTGGNINLITKQWTWVNVRGDTAKDWDYWFQRAFEQGVTIIDGTYDYDKRAKRLRCLNLRVQGRKDAVDSLHSVIEMMSGRK